MNEKLKKLVICAVTAAAYVALTVIFAPISFGLVQFRIAEALCILPFLSPFTMWGLFIGCIISNLLGPIGIPDIVFGSLATLAAGFLTSKIKIKWLVPIPTILVNALVVGAILAFYVQDLDVAYPLAALQVAIGEAVVLYALGLPLLIVLSRMNFFKKENL